MDERLKQLLMLRKEDMTMGQLFELTRFRPEEMDGYLFEQKINRTISEEFVRLQGRVDGAFQAVTASYQRFADLEQKLDVLRAQLSRVGKFEGQIDAFNRAQMENAMQMQGLSDRLLDFHTQFRQGTEVINRKIFKIETDIKEMNKIIDEPQEIKQMKKKIFNDQLESMEMRLAQKHLDLERQFSEFQEQTTKSRLETEKIVVGLKVGFEAISEPFKQNSFTLTEHSRDLERHKKVIEEVQEHVQAIKNYSLLTNLHVEAYLPFQVASQVYETCEVLAQKKLKIAFRKKFTTKLEELEQNLLNCCNPATVGQYKSPYRKINYELPKSYLSPELEPEEGDGDKEAQKKLKQKLLKFLKEKMQRDATRDSSIENVIILFGGVSIDQLHVKMREEMYGFKYADDYIFKLNKERDRLAVEKAAAEQASGQAAPIADFGALRMQVNYELMKSKVNTESLVKKSAQQLRDVLDQLEERINNRMFRQDNEKEKLEQNLEKAREQIQAAEERVSQTLKKTADLEVSFSYQTQETKSFISQMVDTLLSQKLDSFSQQAQAAAQQRVTSVVNDISKKSVSFIDDKNSPSNSLNDKDKDSQKESNQVNQSNKIDIVEVVASANKMSIVNEHVQDSSLSARSSRLSASSYEQQNKQKTEMQINTTKLNQETQKPQNTNATQGKSDGSTRQQSLPIKRQLSYKRESDAAINQIKKKSSLLDIRAQNAQKDNQRQIINSQPSTHRQSDEELPISPTYEPKKTNEDKSEERINRDKGTLMLNIQEASSNQVITGQEQVQHLSEETANIQTHQASDLTQEKPTQKVSSELAKTGDEVKLLGLSQLKPQQTYMKTSRAPSEIIEEKDETTPASRFAQSLSHSGEILENTSSIHKQVASVSVSDNSRALNSNFNSSLKVQTLETKTSIQSANENPLENIQLSTKNNDTLEMPRLVLPETSNIDSETFMHMKNDKIQVLIARSKKGNTRLIQLGNFIKQSTGETIQTFTEQAVKPVLTVEVQEQQQSELKPVQQQTQQLSQLKSKRPDSSNSKRSKNSYATSSRRNTLGKFRNNNKDTEESPQNRRQTLRISRDNVSTISKGESSNNPLSDYQSEIDQDYGDDYGEGTEYDMKNYVKTESLQSFIAQQDQFNQNNYQMQQQFIKELEKRDQILQQLLKEQADHNHDVLALMHIVSAVDLRIMDRAEVRVNTSLGRFESMFDIFKKAITTDVKRWRQESVDVQVKSQKDSVRIDHLHKMVSNLNTRAQKFQDLMLGQVYNIEGLLDIQLRLNKQDEEDKKTTSLIGIREKEVQTLTGKQDRTSKQQPAQGSIGQTLSLDPRCLNCEHDASQKQMIFQKFKMACLSYKPSAIELEGGIKYSREEVFGLQEQSLVQIKQAQTLTRQSLDTINTLVGSQLQELVKISGIDPSMVKTSEEDTIVQNKEKKVEDPREKRQILSQAVTLSQQVDANRFGKLRKELRSQPGGTRPVHKILVLDSITNQDSRQYANSLNSINNLEQTSVGSEYQVQLASTNQHTERSNVMNTHRQLKGDGGRDSNTLPVIMITPRSGNTSNFDSKTFSQSGATNRARFSQTNGFQR